MQAARNPCPEWMRQQSLALFNQHFAAPPSHFLPSRRVLELFRATGEVDHAGARLCDLHIVAGHETPQETRDVLHSMNGKQHVADRE